MSKKEILFLILIVSIFLFMEVSFIRFPGMDLDESWMILDTIKIKDALSKSSMLDGILTGGIPLVRHWCHGTSDYFILLFIFNLLPISVESSRLMAIFLGGLIIFLTYFFAKELFNKRYALLAIVLLVFHPSFIMGTKVGVNLGTIANAVYMGVLFCLIKWYRLKKNFYFYLAMFLVGLGTWTRLWFLWFIFGLAITLVVFKDNVRQRFEIDKSSKALKYVIWGGIFFLLGCLPVIYHTYLTKFSDIKYLWKCAQDTSLQGNGHNNLQYIRNLLYVKDFFNQHLTGSFYFVRQFNDYNSPFTNSFYPFALILSTIYFFVSGILKRDMPYRRRSLFLTVLFIAMFLVTPFSWSYLPWCHFYFFCPIVQLIISAAMVSFIQYFKKSKIVISIIAAFSILLIVKEINGLRGYFYYLNKTGGKGDDSSAIYDLTEYLLDENPSSVIEGSHGFGYGIDVVSGGRILTQHAHPDRHRHLFEEAESLNQFFGTPNSLYVFFPKEISPSYNNLENFIAAAKQLGLNFVEVKRFYERDGSGPVYLVYAVK